MDLFRLVALLKKYGQHLDDCPRQSLHRYKQPLSIEHYDDIKCRCGLDEVLAGEPSSHQAALPTNSGASEWDAALEAAADLLDRRGSYGDEHMADEIRALQMPEGTTAALPIAEEDRELVADALREAADEAATTAQVKRLRGLAARLEGK